MKIIVPGLAAVLLLSSAACQTGGGGGTVVVDAEPKTFAEWMVWINQRLNQACGYQANLEFLLSVYGKGQYATVIAQICNVVEAARLERKRPLSATRRQGVTGTVVGVPFDPMRDGTFTRI